MDTLAEMLATGRDREGVAFEAPARRTPTSHREFATNAWKAGNLLRHYGVRPGSRAALVVGPKERDSEQAPGRLGSAPDPLFGLLGATAVGATVDVTPDSPVEARALVVPAPWLDRYEAAPGCSIIAYGSPPERPEVAHFERERWSENPTEPPGSVAPDDPAIQAEDREYTHAELLGAARSIVREYTLEADDIVAVAAPLTGAGAIAAGIIAPLVAGATVRPVGAEDGSVESGAVYTVSSDTDGGASDGNRGSSVASDGNRGNSGASDRTEGDYATIVDPSTVID